MKPKIKLTIKKPKLIGLSKCVMAILYTIVLIACVPLSIFFPINWIFDFIYANFQPYYLFFGSGDDSMLQMFFFFVYAWYLFAIFYFGVQLIAKCIGKEKINIKTRLKSFLLDFVSFTIFYILFFSIDVSNTLLEGIRIIVCNIISIDFCNYSISLFGFPDEKILYLVFIVWFFIVTFFVYLLYKIYLLKRSINKEKTKTKYYYLTFLIIFTLIPLLLYISVYPFGKKTMEEIKILSDEDIINYVNDTRIFNNEVDKIVDTFNYCTTIEDCEVFRGPYPFDCNQVVNKEKVEVSKTIMNNMTKKYNWSGPQFCDDLIPNISCENNKCVLDEEYNY